MSRFDVTYGPIRWLLVLVLVSATTFVSSMRAIAVQGTSSEFVGVWMRADWPVAQGHAQRTWMWGPFNGQPLNEQYVDAPGGSRFVQYTDKSRMEINARVDPQHAWRVTNGLLVRELVSGRLQLGDDTFEQRDPARIPVAGDEQGDGPTYQRLGSLQHEPALASGTVVVRQLAADGTVVADPDLEQFGVTVSDSVAATAHSIASVFVETFTKPGWVYDDHLGIYPAPLVSDMTYATGYPITEPYWMTVPVGGTPKLVLVQAFERRVLTYTPTNPDGWKVETGNVGRHYYRWRYGVDPPAPALYPEPGPPISARQFSIGSSVNGVPIEAIRIGTGRIRIVCVGGIHTGEEVNASQSVQVLADQFMRQPELVPADVSLIFVPLLNPDGATIGQRTNAHGVDLNRNWPSTWQPWAIHGDEIVSGGTHPLSEPEANALYDLIATLKPNAVLSWHSAYPPVGVTEGNDLALGTKLASEFAAGAGFLPLDEWYLYPITGQLIDTAEDLGIPAMDIELPGWESTYADQNLAGMLEMIHYMVANTSLP